MRKGMWWYCRSVSHIHKGQRVLVETTLNPVHPQTLWSYSCVSFLFCLGVIQIVFLARVWGVIAFLRMSYRCVIFHSFMDFKVFKAIYISVFHYITCRPEFMPQDSGQVFHLINITAYTMCQDSWSFPLQEVVVDPLRKEVCIQ